MRSDNHGKQVRSSCALGVLTLLLGVAASETLAIATEPTGSVTITADEHWHTVFGDQEIVRHFRTHTTLPREGLAMWMLSYEGRSLARGESPFVARPEGSPAFAIRVPIPPVRDQIRMPLRLAVTLLDGVTRNELAAWEETLWVFPKDPFVSLRERLASLPILLIDPAGETATAFTSLGIPFSRVRNVAALEGEARGLLVVGSGVDFSKQRGLWESLVALADRALPVLVLAPSGGRVSLDDPRLRTGAWRLRHAEVICSLDVTLDDAAWPPEGRITATGMSLVPSREGVAGEFQPGADGWPWLEVDLPAGGTLVVCGFDIVGKIEEGPSPRHLLAAALLHLVDHGKSSKGDSHEQKR